MTTELSQGANAAVGGGTASVRFAWNAPADLDADASAYLLAATGQVRGDHDMIFYNQPSGADGAVRFDGSDGQGRFDVDLARVPDAIEKIVFCVTINEANSRGQTMALLRNAALTVSGGSDLRFAPALNAAREAAMIFGELYRRQGQWKFRAVGQGFAGGLAPLARSFGIDVADASAAPATPPPAPPPPAPAPPPSVNLSKVTLDKPGQSVSLQKRGASFGEIIVNLNWSRARGWLAGGAIDLDLGCLFELANGRKGVVQALGNAFGGFDRPPFIQLSGDDRTGDVSDGETLRINGGRWAELKRMCVFANIYDGVPNWQRTDGVVTVTMPDQAPIEVRMTDGRNDMRLCGIVMLENDGGEIKATRLVDYVRDQEKLDQRFSWGLRWRAGTKD